MIYQELSLYVQKVCGNKHWIGGWDTCGILEKKNILILLFSTQKLYLEILIYVLLVLNVQKVINANLKSLDAKIFDN